jgi:hypothetical protein
MSMSMRKAAFAFGAVLLTASLVNAQQSAPPAAPKSAAPSATDVTGNWNGTLKPDDASKSEETGLLILKQDGAVVTGTAGPNVDQRLPISKGKIATTKDGTVLTFELTSPGGMLMQFEMKLADGHLKGTAKAEMDGQKRSATVDFTRAK